MLRLGVLCGVLASLALHLYETSRPHLAVVGEVPGTEHFRNIERYEVIVHEQIVSLRVDESLYFANAPISRTPSITCSRKSPPCGTWC